MRCRSASFVLRTAESRPAYADVRTGRSYMRRGERDGRKRFQYLIIGNSTAAIGCVEGIRSAGGTEPIAIVSEEPHHTYSRPLISYLCMGRTDEERMKYRPDDFYEKNDCTLYMGVRAVRIETKEKTLLLSDGRTLGYEKAFDRRGVASVCSRLYGDRKRFGQTYVYVAGRRARPNGVASFGQPRIDYRCGADRTEMRGGHSRARGECNGGRYGGSDSAKHSGCRGCADHAGLSGEKRACALSFRTALRVFQAVVRF